MRWALIAFIVLSFSYSIANATTWHEVARWDGYGMKNTDTFYIKSRKWRVTWSFNSEDGSFVIIAKREDGSASDLVANRLVEGSASGSTILRFGPGECYLDISCTGPANSWTVIVEDKR